MTVLDNILERNKYFYLCIKSKIDFDATGVESKIKNIKLIEKLGNFAWRNHPGCFFDAEIENLLSHYGSNFDNLVDTENISKEIDELYPVSKEYSTLHVATEIGSAGGHTRIINQMIKRTTELNQYFILTKSDVSIVPDWFQAGIDESTKIFSLNKYKTHFEKAFALRVLSRRFKRIIIYTHPFDVIPSLAFAIKSNVAVAVENHAHSWFWYGAGIADLIFCHTQYHTEFTRNYRKIDNCFYLPFSQMDVFNNLPDIEAKRKARDFLNIDSNKTIILSVATREKFIPNHEYNYFKILNDILNKYPDVVCIVVGLPGTDRLAKDVNKSERLFFYQHITDLTNFYLASDICLESMPQPSLGVQILAPVIGLSCPIPKYGKSKVFNSNTLFESNLYNKHFGKGMSKNEFFEKLDLFIKDSQLRLEIAEEIRAHYLRSNSDHAIHEKLTELYKIIDSLNHTPKLLDETIFFKDEENIEIAERSEFQNLSQVIDYWRNELTKDDLSQFLTIHKASTASLIAFYLPQYHPIPENDQWWGKGFTEWTNVAKAKQIFPGHYQPHLPADLGFYDLRLPEVREAQAELARRYGISGFCYYHYWFNGKRLLNRIFDEVLISGKPDYPFCLCWANENWTRVWDGGDKNILVEQKYSPEDDKAHITWLINAFKDPRYIKLNGRPLLLVYRTSDLPDPERTASLWRDEVKLAGFPDLYLCKVESFTNEHTDPHVSGFDAAIEFQPDWSNLGRKSDQHPGLNVFNYDDVAERMMRKDNPAYTRFPCVTPSWDNTARRGRDGHIFHNSRPAYYEKWLRHALSRTSENAPDERIVFINAWNEWGEGNHLEPDQRHGHAYLHATKRALAIGTEESKLIDALTEKAAAALEGGRLYEAEQFLVEAIDYDPLAPQVQHQCAILLFQQGRSHEAIETMNRALSIEPGNAEFNNDIGAMYHAAGDIAKTLHHFEKALEINPEDITSLKNLTEIFIEKEQFGVARDICNRLRSIYPDDKEVDHLWSLIQDKLVQHINPDNGMADKSLIPFPESDKPHENLPQSRPTVKLDVRAKAEGIVCLQPFYMMEFTTNGLVYSCCPAWTKVSIGHIGKSSIAEIWNSKQARLLRRKILEGRFQDVCNDICPYIAEHRHTGKLIMLSDLEHIEVLTPDLIKEIRAGRDMLTSSPTVFNLSNSTVCNLSCLMCTRHADGYNPELVQKTATDLESYLSQAKRITLSGMGDPFARPDTRNLMIKNVNKDLILDLITNGLLLPKYWNDVRHCRFGNLLVSVDASDEQTYEKIRQGGKWKDLLHSLSVIRENRDHFQSVTLNMTIMRKNAASIPEFIDFTESYGFNASFQRIRGMYGDENIFEMNDTAALNALSDTVTSEKNKKRSINVYFGDLLEFVRHETPAPSIKPDPPCMISIILSVKNNLNGTSLSIQSILENIQDQAVELIVVDNGSEDGTRDYLNQLKHKKITVILPENESTSAQGAVLAAKKASGAFLMFLDNTVIVIKSWIQNIMKILENTSGWDALVGKTVTENKFIMEAGSTTISEAGLKSRGAGIPFLDPAYNFTCQVESGSRYGLLIRKDVWDKVKAFNPELEDISSALIDLGLKITSMGYRIVYQPQCILLANNMATRQPVITNELSPSPETLVSLRPPDFTVSVIPKNNMTAHKNILILGIYLANSLNTVTDIISVFSGSKLHAVTQKWVALNGQPPDATTSGVTVKNLNGRVPKFQIINELLQEEDLFHYDYIILCDDDVVLPKDFVASFIAMQSRLEFAIAQPARTLNSYIDHPIVARHIGVDARETHFVEIGPVVSFHQKVYDFVFPFDLTSPMGWGYENAWAYEAIRRNLKMGIIDAVCVDHSLRKPVVNYEWNQANKERTAYLEKNVHLPLEECFRVVNAHIMPTESI
jgi:MoaA/NifB/PqqE/SkfB family radical SAM enzyme/GT2 family glycosyltransferase